MGQAGHPVGEPKQEGDAQDVGRAPQGEAPAPPPAGLAAFEAIQLEGERHARHEEEQRRGHAAEELREHIGAALAQIHPREGIEDVALDHDDHRQPAHPVEERESLHKQSAAETG